MPHPLVISFASHKPFVFSNEKRCVHAVDQTRGFTYCIKRTYVRAARAMANICSIKLYLKLKQKTFPNFKKVYIKLNPINLNIN